MEKVRPWCGQLSDRGRLKNIRVTSAHLEGVECWFPVLAMPRSSISASAELLFLVDVHLVASFVDGLEDLFPK